MIENGSIEYMFRKCYPGTFYGKLNRLYNRNVTLRYDLIETIRDSSSFKYNVSELPFTLASHEICRVHNKIYTQKRGLRSGHRKRIVIVNALYYKHTHTLRNDAEIHFDLIDL